MLRYFEVFLNFCLESITTLSICIHHEKLLLMSILVELFIEKKILKINMWSAYQVRGVSKILSKYRCAKKLEINLGKNQFL